MAELIKVATVKDIAPGEHKIIVVGDTKVGIVRDPAGNWFAIEDVCTHDGGQLTGGTICGHEIECPRHGARFDLRTGAALCPPAYEATAVFPIRIEDGVVWVRDDRWD